MEIDQIFVGIHIRVTRLISSLIPPFVRSLLIASSLCLSLFLLTSLISLHHQHIHPHGTYYQLTGAGASSTDRRSPSVRPGFPSLVRWIDQCDIVRVEIFPPSPSYDPLTLNAWSSWWLHNEKVNISRQGDRRQEERQEEAVSVSMDMQADGALTFSSFSSPSPLPLILATLNASSPAPPPPSRPPSYTFEYARHKGFFLLPSSLYSRHSIVTITIGLSASHPSFGPFPLSLLTYHLFGYDSILLNHLIRQMQTGFMRNVHTNDIFTLSRSKETTKYNTTWKTEPPLPPPPFTLRRIFHMMYLLFFKSELLITTLFLFFATTTLVSSTLTQTQLRMLHFTDQLRQHLRLHLPIIGLVLEHTMQSLSFVPVVVGILFFLFEFFNDQILAFLLLITVWLCESYCVLFTRTATSMLYFPKLFALYFLMFGVYFFSFPYGFHYIAMGLTASQLYTCMAYYFFHYEIPAVDAGHITIHRPRMLVLRRSEGDRGNSRRGVEVGTGRGQAAAASPAILASPRASRTGSVEAAGGRGRESELLARLLGLWDERQREAQEEDGVGREGRGEEVDSEEALDFSRRELRREHLQPPAELVPAQQVREERRSSRIAQLVESASTQPSAGPSASSQPPLSSSSPFPSSQSSPSFSLEPFAAPSSTPPSLSLQYSLLPSSPQPALTHSTSSSLPHRMTPSPAPTRSSSSSSQSVPSSPPVSSSAPPPEALLHLASLPQLLLTMIKNTQLLKLAAGLSSPSSHRSHRSRASSMHSPTLSPMPKDQPAMSPRSRRSSHPHHPPNLTALSLSNHQESKQEQCISPLPAFLPPPPPPPPPPSQLATADPSVLHRAVVEQLAHVLQVSLFVLRTLVDLSPSTASLLSHPTEASIPSSSSLPSLASLQSSLSPPASVSGSPTSPRPPQSPLRSSPSPRSSPPRRSPSSARPSTASLPSPSSSASRRLFSREAVSSSPSSVLLHAVGGRGGRVAHEPVSPDPLTDAPMM